MTGRGIDQVLPDSVAPRLYEPYLTDAREYVRLAEMANGSIPKPVDYAYIWGDALEELARAAPDIRIINLETAVTVSDQFWPRKGINYRMHPKNSEVLRAASIDCCVLANNHVLDWGYTGLAETLTTLEQSGIKYAGAGQNKAAAQAPAVIAVANKGRVLVFSIAAQSSGVPGSWAAGRRRAGVHLIEDYSEKTIDTLASLFNEYRRPGDIVVVSIHWGGNWGYSVSEKEQAFAHGLIDTAGIDLLHGHSSHHVKGIEVYKGKPILYGCGDLINDYEGIRGHKEYRGDLSLMYLPSLNPNDGRLVQFKPF
jgi:poly-gamma-glutamate synthesis protein (capsule biosynthesis protein)